MVPIPPSGITAEHRSGSSSLAQQGVVYKNEYRYKIQKQNNKYKNYRNKQHVSKIPTNIKKGMH